MLKTETPVCDVQPTEWDIESLVNHSFSHIPAGLELRGGTSSSASSVSEPSSRRITPTTTVPRGRGKSIHQFPVVTSSEKENHQKKKNDPLTSDQYVDPNELET
ncbi:hypothetical protein AGDE_16276 [Angomonas deanei]|nr:hypothetical protein AGDE_16276 [Angomonas deanei]|eukprot:EPY17390.1 hypothetical protein AGDE_16276 [Angomonas deanei]